MKVEEAKGLNWLYIDINSYFASVEQQVKPELRGKPVIVVPMLTDSTCAIAASYEAKACGIKTGTRVFEAKKLCKNLEMVQASHKLYTEFHHKIMNVIGTIIPVTEIRSIDEAAIQLIGSEREKGKSRKIALEIKKKIEDEVGVAIKCSIGIAPNKYLSKIASNLQKPDGLTILEMEDLPSKLKHWNLMDLTGIGRNTSLRLERAGIRTIDDLWQKSRKELRHIWGSVVGERYWYKLHGYQLVSIKTNKSTIGHSKILAPEDKIPTNTKKILFNLTQKAIFRCRIGGFYSGFITINASSISRRKYQFQQKIEPSCDDLTIQRVVKTLWNKVPKTEYFRKVSVTLSDLSRKKELSEDLFANLKNTESNRQKKSEQLSIALDSLKIKYSDNEIIKFGANEINAQKKESKIAFARVPEKIEFN